MIFFSLPKKFPSTIKPTKQPYNNLKKPKLEIQIPNDIHEVQPSKKKKNIFKRKTLIIEQASKNNKNKKTLTE